MFPRRPDPKKAQKELNSNVVLFGTMVVTVRLLPYVLHLYQKATSR